LSRPALLMLPSMVPARDSILPPGPNGNLALQPGQSNSPQDGLNQRKHPLQNRAKANEHNQQL
jgi:hypothetical protein